MRVGAAKSILKKLKELGDLAKRVYMIEYKTWVSFKSYPSRKEAKIWVKKDEKGPVLPRLQMTDKKTLLMVAFIPNKETRNSLLKEQ